jgi:hypothetical protein
VRLLGRGEDIVFSLGGRGVIIFLWTGEFPMNWAGGGVENTQSSTFKEDIETDRQMWNCRDPAIKESRRHRWAEEQQEEVPNSFYLDSMKDFPQRHEEMPELSAAKLCSMPFLAWGSSRSRGIETRMFNFPFFGLETLARSRVSFDH